MILEKIFEDGQPRLEYMARETYEDEARNGQKYSAIAEDQFYE